MKILQVGTHLAQINDLLLVRDPVMSQWQSLKICLGLQILNNFDEVVIEVESLQLTALRQALNLVDLIEWEYECLQVDETIECLYLAYTIIE